MLEFNTTLLCAKSVKFMELYTFQLCYFMMATSVQHRIQIDLQHDFSRHFVFQQLMKKRKIVQPKINMHVCVFVCLYCMWKVSLSEIRSTILWEQREKRGEGREENRFWIQANHFKGLNLATEFFETFSYTRWEEKRVLVKKIKIKKEEGR